MLIKCVVGSMIFDSNQMVVCVGLESVFLCCIDIGAASKLLVIVVTTFQLLFPLQNEKKGEGHTSCVSSFWRDIEIFN